MTFKGDTVLSEMFKQIRDNILACSVFMLSIFSVYYTMVVMYTHFHVINGVTITHAHPFHGEHNHTQEQLLVLDFFSHFYSDGSDELPHIDAPYRPLLYTLDQDYEAPFILPVYSNGIFHRGPPSLFIYC